MKRFIKELKENRLIIIIILLIIMGLILLVAAGMAIWQVIDWFNDRYKEYKGRD